MFEFGMNINPYLSLPAEFAKSILPKNWNGFLFKQLFVYNEPVCELQSNAASFTKPDGL